MARQPENYSEALLIQQSIARRYARALFESVGGDFERVGEELAAVADALTGSDEALALFTDPRFDRSTRTKAIEQIIEAAKVHPLLGNLLRLLNDRERIAELPQITRVYRDMADAQGGRLRATLTSAAPLPAEMIDRMAAALAQATDKKVILDTREDPALLGGVVAQVGNVVYDGSLRTQLESLRRELSGRV